MTLTEVSQKQNRISHLSFTDFSGLFNAAVFIFTIFKTTLKNVM